MGAGLSKVLSANRDNECATVLRFLSTSILNLKSYTPGSGSAILFILLTFGTMWETLDTS